MGGFSISPKFCTDFYETEKKVTFHPQTQERRTYTRLESLTNWLSHIALLLFTTGFDLVFSTTRKTDQEDPVSRRLWAPRYILQDPTVRDCFRI